MTNDQQSPAPPPAPPGDHDVHYVFGRRPRASATYPFSTRQYARLLVLRSRLQDGLPALDLPPRAA
jgi:hypothetical protein